MPLRPYDGDRKFATIDTGGSPVGISGTAFSVTSAAVTDFPTGPRTFRLPSGESIIVTAGFGTTSWSGITRGANQTTPFQASIPDGTVLTEILGANDDAAFVQRGEVGTTFVAPGTPAPAHAASHGQAGSDPVSLDASQVATGALAKARQNSNTAYTDTAQSFTAEVTVPDLKVTGLTGSVQASRYAGMTASGAPTTGPHLIGDAVLSLADARWYVCTAAGTPGTFVTDGAGTVQSANRVLAGPTTGSPALPTYRALVAADLPLATAGAFGAVKPDGSTITIAAGVISSGGGGGGARILQLDYALASDISGNAISAGTWTDLIGNQNFTVTSGSGTIAIAVAVGGFFLPNSSMPAGDSAILQLVIDSAGANLQEGFGVAFAGAIAGYIQMSGSRTLFLTGLTAGTHTVKVQAYIDVAATMFCRPVLHPGRDFLRIQVLEWD